ncbi:hypothetical protein Taro_031027 [Colocasia esculenta]|uniref:Uncharacterized protein n=1 Tax=Colocasia esculenta TaxID=4460 RepID=A0A843W1Y6_COLES|nr:hypothetical protein [Colocasia esculenta]
MVSDVYLILAAIDVAVNLLSPSRLKFSMAPRRRPREGVVEQVTRQEVGDAPPPQQTQPLTQDAHSGIVPPPPPPPHALIATRVTDLDVAYQTAAALEADTLRTRARSAEVQTQVVPSQPHQQQGSVQTTPRTATSYASTSTGTTTKSGSRRKFRRDRRQAEQRQQSVGSVQQPTGQPSQQTGGSGGSRGRGRATHLTRADAEAAHLVEGVGAAPSRRLVCGYPPLVSQDVECDSILCVLLVVVLSRSPWSPFSTARVKRRGKTGRGPDARESVGLRRLQFQANLATPVLVLRSCSE